MVLIAPSVHALKTLLSICELYAELHDIIYNTEKTECMICWPKKFLFKFSPKFSLQNDVLEYVEVFKYLGVMINDQCSDDEEIKMRMRAIYASGNMLIRKFANCNLVCKLTMFRNFLGTFMLVVYGLNIRSHPMLKSKSLTMTYSEIC